MCEADGNGVDEVVNDHYNSVDAVDVYVQKRRGRIPDSPSQRADTGRRSRSVSPAKNIHVKKIYKIVVQLSEIHEPA